MIDTHSSTSFTPYEYMEPGAPPPVDKVPDKAAKPIYSSNRERTVDSLETLRPSLSKTGLFFEDLSGFLKNFFLWPIHGYRLIVHQIVFIFLLPILIFPIVMLEILNVFITILTCGCARSIDQGPKFELTAPSKDEYASLKAIVDREKGDPRFTDSHVRLLHTLKTYLDFADDYANSPFRGKKNDHFNCLIKVRVGDTGKIFQYQPHSRNQRFLQEYLVFVQENSSAGETVHQTFVGLDYSYFLGMLKLKAKTDLVDFPITAESCSEAPDHSSAYSRLSRFVTAPFRWIQPREIGTHVEGKTSKGDTFWMWPGFTRKYICQVVNKSLQGKHLTSDHISLWDLENIVVF